MGTMNQSIFHVDRLATHGKQSAKDCSYFPPTSMRGYWVNAGLPTMFRGALVHRGHEISLLCTLLTMGLRDYATTLAYVFLVVY